MSKKPHIPLPPTVRASGSPRWTCKACGQVNFLHQSRCGYCKIKRRFELFDLPPKPTPMLLVALLLLSGCTPTRTVTLSHTAAPTVVRETITIDRAGRAPLPQLDTLYLVRDRIIERTVPVTVVRYAEALPDTVPAFHLIAFNASDTTITLRSRASDQTLRLPVRGEVLHAVAASEDSLSMVVEGEPQAETITIECPDPTKTLAYRVRQFWRYVMMFVGGAVAMVVGWGLLRFMGRI